ncbi:MAG: acyl-[acyl-carrier-protein]--UDP-N-acetylglucosamine O-acyltransferase [Nautilia sp.]|nr:MAG: acyl-[acyl-carrier-protein]--UDP-N-acetylglucosamine O-acyltransferase [Nautilia sp.]
MIHKTAIIEEGAKIGENVEIGAYAYIGKNVTIGDNTKIHHHANIEGVTTIGEGNEIFPYASVGTAPQDLKYNGEDTELIIGDYNKIREFTLINTGTIQDNGKTIIGNNNLFMGYVHVAHDCVIGNYCIFANAATLAGHVHIDDGAVVGGMTPIHQFVHIGSLAMVAGASAVSQDVPPFCMVEGNRAKLRGLNLTGLRRKFENKKDIDEVKRAYKELFESGKPLKETAKEIFETTENIYVKKLAEFVINSKRGIAYDRKM